MRHSNITDNSDVKLSFTTLKQLVPYLFEFKKRIALAFLFLIAAKFASIGLPFVLKYAVDALNQRESMPTELSIPLGLLLAYGAARFSTVLFGEIRDTLFGRVTERAMRRIGLKVFKHLHKLDLAFHLDRRTGGLSRDIERGTNGISFLLRFMVFSILPTLIEILIVMIILWSNYHFGFALIVFVSVWIYGAYSVKATEWRTEFVRAANKADSSTNTQAVDSLLNYETVKYFSNEDFEAKRYDDELAGWESARRKNRLSLFVLNAGQALIIALSLTSMMVLAAHYVVEGAMTIGDFVLINAFMMQIFLPLNFLGFVYREMKGALANIESMFTLLRQDPAVKDLPDAAVIEVNQGRVEFNNVSFAYNPKRQILKNVSFNVEPNQKVAIVGSSGSGKSTIVKLLYRFYDVTSGEICIDQQNIAEVTQGSLRQNLGMVPQDTVLFNDSIYNNIAYGRVEASEAEVRRAIQMAHLEDFINELPDGWHTQVGERGLKLSGGEKQRVAIARTILKHPNIVIFDEATSSLDSHSEKQILKAINQVAQEQTSIVIAHRLSTIVDADNIIVLDKGEVVEQGSHHQLIEQGGHYAKLWQVQQQTED